MKNRRSPTLPPVVDDPATITRGIERLGLGWLAVALPATAVGWNEAAEGVLGLPDAADGGVDLRPVFLHTDGGEPAHPADACPAFGRSNQPVAEPDTIEDVRRPDGQVVTIRYVVERGTSPEIATTVIFESMTTLRTLESDLQQEAAFRRLLASATDDILVVVDDNATLLSLHGAMLGPATEVALGTNAFEYVPRVDHGALRRALAAVFDRADDADFEARAPGVDGSLRHYACRARPLGSAGRPAAAVIVARDVTERRSLEEQVRALQAEVAALRHGV